MKNPLNSANRDLVIISDIQLGADHCCKQELYEYFRTIFPRKIVFLGRFAEEKYWQKLVDDGFYAQLLNMISGWIKNGSQVYFTGKTKPELLEFLLKTDKSKFICKSRLEFRIDHKTYLITGQEHLNAGSFKLGGITFGRKPGFYFHHYLPGLFYKIFKTQKPEIGRHLVNSKGKLNIFSNYFNKIENNSILIADKNNYDGVITGLIQEPKITLHPCRQRNISYINTSDWNSSLSALEYSHGKWELHIHEEHFFGFSLPRLEVIR